MKRTAASLASLLLAVGFLGLSPSVASARKHAPKPAFRYVGGTMALPERCYGKLEMNSTSMTFKCADGSVDIPYASILLMQYRPNVSRKVRQMKPRWKVKPQIYSGWFGGKNNRYFTVIYQQNDQSPANALVLQVSPDDMRPYLAEIDVKVGQRVEVENLDNYD
jgi:hypothetical protein